MGKVYEIQDNEIDEMKVKLDVVLDSFKHFRASLATIKDFFRGNVFPLPVSELSKHHTLVFNTVLALRRQEGLNERARTLIYDFRKDYKRSTKENLDDDEIMKVVKTLAKETRKCEKDTISLLDELGRRFSVDIQLHYEDETEDGEVTEPAPGETRITLELRGGGQYYIGNRSPLADDELM